MTRAQMPCKFATILSAARKTGFRFDKTQFNRRNGRQELWVSRVGNGYVCGAQFVIEPDDTFVEVWLVHPNGDRHVYEPMRQHFDDQAVAGIEVFSTLCALYLDAETGAAENGVPVEEFLARLAAE